MLIYGPFSRLKALAARSGPTIVSVEGRLGVSPLGLVNAATDEHRRVLIVPPGLTDPENLNDFASSLEPFGAWQGSPPTGWTELLASLSGLAPLTLVIDRPRSLAAVNRRFWRSFGDAWGRVKASGQRIHVFLLASERGLGARLNRTDSPLWDPTASLRPGPGRAPVDVVEVDPGTHFDLARAFPHWTGPDLLTAWALFGGLPGTWSLASGREGPVAALQRLVEGAHPALLDGPLARLERAVQTSNRYASVLSAVARGGRTWRDVSEGVSPASTNRSASGPYLKRLRELGLVAVDRPLGAAARGRRSRYRLTDPHEALWWSLIHPNRARILSGDGPALWREAIRPAVEASAGAVLPMVARNFLRFGARSTLGANAREAGQLWGEGFDFPVAATLDNGAVCYGTVHRGPGPAPLSAFPELDRQVRETRYGWGRQARIRLVFSLSGFADDLLREAARNPLLVLIGTKELTQAATKETA